MKLKVAIVIFIPWRRRASIGIGWESFPCQQGGNHNYCNTAKTLSDIEASKQKPTPCLSSPSPSRTTGRVSNHTMHVAALMNRTRMPALIYANQTQTKSSAGWKLKIMLTWRRAQFTLKHPRSLWPLKCICYASHCNISCYLIYIWGFSDKDSNFYPIKPVLCQGGGNHMKENDCWPFPTSWSAS